MLTSNEVEAANRSEVTAILIRAGYRVYRPEADVGGEDLVIRDPDGNLRKVQLKARPIVDWPRYGQKDIWMIFPDQLGPRAGRRWFLLPHDDFFVWVKSRHGHSAGWREAWSYPTVSMRLAEFLKAYLLPG